MDFGEILESLKTMQQSQSFLIQYIEDEENTEENYENIIKLFNDCQILKNKHMFKLTLNLILKIFKNHNHTQGFFQKFEKLFLFFKDTIKKTFSISEIYNLFKKHKKIVLFLVENKIIDISNFISFLNNEPNNHLEKDNYYHYFFKELKPLANDLNNQNTNAIESLEYFEEQRDKGENHKYICKLIRDDNINLFIAYVKKKNLPLTAKINFSIFETNSFLIKNQPTLIEYAAFHGSVKIFKYLKNNSVELTPSLWLYAIHSNKLDIINILEDHIIEPEDKSLEKCLKESIKCHHMELILYFRNKIFRDITISPESFENKKDETIFSYCIQYYNFCFFPIDVINNNYYFPYFCKYDYYYIVQLLFKIYKINITKKTDVLIYLFRRLLSNLYLIL